MYLVLNRNNFLPYKDQYRLFHNRNKAITYAKSLGFEDSFGMGIVDKPGVMNVYCCGDINLGIMKLDIDDQPEG